MAIIQRAGLQRGDMALFDGVTRTASRIDATGGTITGLTVGEVVDVLQVYGLGTDRTRSTIATAVANIGTSNSVTLLFSTGTWTIDSSLSIPANFTCAFPRGCVLSVSGGATLTIGGPVDAGLHRIFSGSGTVVLNSQSVAVPQWWGAAADGSTNDTTALQGALTSTANVYIPPTANYYSVSSVLSLSIAGQRVYGEGVRSKIVQSGTNGNSNVFTADTLNGVKFQGLNLTPGSTVASTFNGFGVYCDDCDYVEISGCTVTGARRGGFGFLDCNYCNVSGNLVRDSIVDPLGGDTQSDTGFDIYFGGACSYNIIQGNHCVGGSGVGIAFQTLTSGDSAIHNIIDSNIVKDQDAYGIMLYILNAADTCERNVVSNNHIDTVTGDITQDDLSDIYGAGIFVQTAEHTVISGNLIRNTNSSGGTPPTTGVPAAIALSGTIANASIVGNVIETSGYYGIAFITASAITHAGRGIVIEGNTVRNTVNAGVFLSNAVRAVVSGNNLDGAAAGQGIAVQQATVSQSDDFVISGNVINDYSVGIQLSGTVARAIVCNNIIRGNTNAAISLTATFSNCHDNVIVNGTGGDGISASSSAVNGFIHHNFISGGDFGIIDDGGATLRVDENIISGSSTSFSTSEYYPIDNTATPSVKNKRWVSNANTTTITMLDDGFPGQVVTLRALASFQLTNGSGLDLAGAANFSMTNLDMVTLKLVGSSWQELSRSVN